MADNCKCIDCGGDQPGHTPDCEYMAEIVGDELPHALNFDVKVAVVNIDPRPCYEDPLAQKGFVAIKLTSNGVQMGDYTVFTNVVDEGAVAHIVETLCRGVITPQIVDFTERHNTRRRRAQYGQANG